MRAGGFSAGAILALPFFFLVAGGEKDLYARLEARCLEKGWKKLALRVEGRERALLWKGPDGPWKQGAILAFHGGGGAASNWGHSAFPIGKAQADFTTAAIARGFAIFALDSTRGVVTDDAGRACGKRWDCMATDRPNIDLPFIEAVIRETLPSARPSGSSEAVFLTGISNGGFMTILAGTQLTDLVNGFAPVSAGDPYGTHMDMGTHPPAERKNAPGTFRDNATKAIVSRDNATGRGVSEKGAAGDNAGERPWPAVTERPVFFKQFHHEDDGGVDLSCMRKARAMLVKHGYRDTGAFVLKGDGKRTLAEHFWQAGYTGPLLDFFSDPGKGTPGGDTKFEVK